MENLLVGIKIKLNPTKEQEVLFWKSSGTARWAWNFALKESEYWYKDTGEKLPQGKIRTFINRVLKPNTHQWLSEVGSNVMKQAVKDFGEAREDYLNGKKGRPKLKHRHKTKPSFYVNYESFKRTKEGFQGEKLGIVKTFQPLPKLKSGETHYSNPRISYDGRNWFLSVSYKIDREDIELSSESLGIDVGIKELAVVSNGEFYENINKTKEVKRLEKKLKRKQRSQARKLESNTKSYAKNCKPIYKKPIKELKNLQKQNAEIRNLHKRLTDIRTNHLHQATSEIVKTKPSRIVMETLNIKGMMKNKHLAKSVARQKLYEFKRQIKYKCKKYDIEFVEADMWFPSSKTCSCCGQIKKDLKLKDRKFICTCGFKLDRDLNASINLANYSI